jgi:hypothetical protein
MSIDEAIALVKANGYRVSKPKSKQVKHRVGPTFVARFADGQVTRMSTFTSLARLDVERGIVLARAAWSSRFPATEVPSIVSAHFEQDDKILARYDFRSGAPKLLVHAP